MANLNHRDSRQRDSDDDDLPELETLLRCSKEAFRFGNISGEEKNKPFREGKVARSETPDAEVQEERSAQQGQFLKGLVGDSNERQSDHPHSNLKPMRFLRLNDLNDDEVQTRPGGIRATPKRSVKMKVDYARFARRDSDGSLSISEDEDSVTDLSGFIVSDSESEGERRKQRSPRKPLGTLHSDISSSGDSDLRRPDISLVQKNVHDISERERFRGSVHHSHNTRDRSSDQEVSSRDSGLEDPFANLKFSPPRYKKPHKLNADQRLVTPPTSPSKSRLLSPSKKNRIPPSPHRPSIDAFWSQNVINDWNDEFSPKKTPRTPGRHRLIVLDEDSETSSPSISPKKSPLKSPSKKDKTLVAKRKQFNEQKNNLATSFLSQLDSTIANKEVSALAATTGGIKIIWSKKLASTAGRANWKREALRRKAPTDGSSSAVDTITTYRHHASIELAEKVIDNEDRLVNVLAHEYCHLATFMISGVRDQPHGTEFKRWAARCTKAFGESHDVYVTTKHSYEIEYKYAWICTRDQCGLEYQRHSKSLDPAKHACGKCKGRLEQVRPVPRKESEYQRYVKANWERVRAGLMTVDGSGSRSGSGSRGGAVSHTVPMGEVMAALAKDFKESKLVKAQSNSCSTANGGGEEKAENVGGKQVENKIRERSNISSKRFDLSDDFDDVMKRLGCIDLVGES